jgi:hypothetical protein
MCSLLGSLGSLAARCEKVSDAQEGRKRERGKTNLLSGVERNILLVEVLVQFENGGDVSASVPVASSASPQIRVEEGGGEGGETKRTDNSNSAHSKP